MPFSVGLFLFQRCWKRNNPTKLRGIRTQEKKIVGRKSRFSANRTSFLGSTSVKREQDFGHGAKGPAVTVCHPGKLSPCRRLRQNPTEATQFAALQPNHRHGSIPECPEPRRSVDYTR